MTTCKNCGNKNPASIRPSICPECGHVMKPVVESTGRKKTKKETIKSEDGTVLEKFEEKNEVSE